MNTAMQSPSPTSLSSSSTPSELPPHERYQYKPHTGSSHSWALGHLSRAPKSARVLDIGSGSGAIGKELRQSGFNSLCAVEIDPQARAHASRIYERAEESLAAYRGQQFDLVLMLDVIEHVAQPEVLVAEAAALLAPGGTLLISVPNVAHWSVRLPLLFGKFDYQSRGILDRTHLQLFTMKRLRAIPKQVPSLALRSASGSIAPAEFVLPAFVSESAWFELLRKVRSFGAQIFPGLFAFQALAEFEKVGT